MRDCQTRGGGGARVSGAGDSGRDRGGRPVAPLRRHPAAGRGQPPGVGAHDAPWPGLAPGLAGHQRHRDAGLCDAVRTPEPGLAGPAVRAVRRGSRASTRRARSASGPGAASARRSTPSAWRGAATTACASTCRRPAPPRPSSPRPAPTQCSARSACRRLATMGWVDAGSLHLDPGAYEATVLLPEGSQLEFVELAPPCLHPIEPRGGWKADLGRVHGGRGRDGAAGARPRVGAAAGGAAARVPGQRPAARGRLAHGRGVGRGRLPRRVARLARGAGGGHPRDRALLALGVRHRAAAGSAGSPTPAARA